MDFPAEDPVAGTCGSGGYVWEVSGVGGGGGMLRNRPDELQSSGFTDGVPHQTSLQTLWIYETFRYTDIHLCANLRKLEVEVVPAVFTGELYPTKDAIPWEVQREMRSVRTFPRLPEQTEIFVTPSQYLLDDAEKKRVWEENVRVLLGVLRERVRGRL